MFNTEWYHGTVIHVYIIYKGINLIVSKNLTILEKYWKKVLYRALLRGLNQTPSDDV